MFHSLHTVFYRNFSQLTCYSISSLIRLKSLFSHRSGKMQLLLASAHRKTFHFTLFCRRERDRGRILVFSAKIGYSLSFHRVQSVTKKGWERQKEIEGGWKKRQVLMEKKPTRMCLSFCHVHWLRRLVSIIFCLLLFKFRFITFLPMCFFLFLILFFYILISSPTSPFYCEVIFETFQRDPNAKC